MKAPLQLIMERAVQLWEDPRHRCKGIARRNSKYGLQYCAIGVLRQAREDLGLPGRQFSMTKLAKALGFGNKLYLVERNDTGTEYFDSLTFDKDNECINNRYYQDDIYQRMKDYAQKGKWL